MAIHYYANISETYIIRCVQVKHHCFMFECNESVWIVPGTVE